LNIVVLVDPGADGVDVRGALRGVGLNELTTAETWAALMQTVVQSKPDLVVIVHRALASEGEGALKAADWSLRPLEIPVIIALGRDEGDQRYPIEMATEFEYFIVEPFDLDHVRNIITDAVGHGRWESSTREVSVVEELTFEVQDEALDEAFENLFDTAAPPVVDPPRRDEPNATTPFAFGDDTDDGEPDGFGSEPIADPRTAPTGTYAQAGTSIPRESMPTASHAATTRIPGVNAAEDASTKAPKPERPRVAFATPVVGMATPPTADESSPGEATDAPAAGSTTVRVTVPDPSAGEIGIWRVPHVLAVLAEQRATGTLRLTRERVRREVTVFSGRPGAPDARSTMTDRSRLLSTFAWTSGTWVFVPDEGVSRTSFMPYADGFEFIWEGITRTLSMNDAAALLTPHLKEHAVYTDRAELVGEQSELAKVRQLWRGFDGGAPFERQMMQLGVQPDEVLRAAWFGMVVGAVAFTREAVSAPVTAEVNMVRASASASYPAMDDDAASSKDTSSQGGSSPGTRSGSSPAIDPAVAEALEALNDTWDRLSSMGAFELFGLSAGDDEGLLTERYYEMVREYHPDRYARVNDPQVRALAEQIFLHIRAQYARARAGETGPRKAVGPGAQAHSPADARRPAGGGASAPSRPAPAAARPPSPTPSSPSSAPSAGAPNRPPPVSDATQRRGPGRRRPVSAVLEDLRRKRSSGSSPTVPSTSTPPSPKPADSGSFSRVSEGPSTGRSRRSTGSRTLSPDQLLRNAVKAIEAGAVDKAADHLTLGRTRGGTGPMYDGVEEYLAYIREERTARHVLKQLKDLSEDAERDWQKSALLLFLGHVHRLEEDEPAALKAYAKARSLDEANLAAQRWERHVKRGVKKGGGKPKSFLDKLMTTKISLGKGK